MTTTQTDALMALADRYAFHIPGSQHSDEARAALLAALRAREWFEEGTNCEHGCIDAVIVRADAIAAPQPAQESIECDCGRIHKKTSYGWVSSEPAQPDQGPST